MAKGQDEKTRLFSKIIMRGEDECWEWTGQMIRDRRGLFENANGTRVSSQKLILVYYGFDVSGKDIIRETCGTVGCMNPKHLKKWTVEDRFWSFVDKREEDECWEWTGALSANGMGLFSLREGKIVQAHRYSWELATGEELPQKRFLFHDCQNNACVNPQHLRFETLEDRFWKNVAVGDPDECWNWVGRDMRHGYGRINIGGEGVPTHRLSYILYYGEILDDVVVRHKCHNRRCVNPFHLELGTHEDNMGDMVRSGRSARGEKNGESKLTESEVREIKQLLKDKTMLKKELAAAYGVDPCTITDIVKGRTWAWVK